MPVTARILLVDDEDTILAASNGDRGLARAAEEAMDVVILLGERGQVADRVKGLALGADDYVVKPFEMAELLARIEARMRTRPSDEAAPGSTVRFGNVEVDLLEDEVRVEGRAVVLAAKELRLLRYLVERPGATVSREELLREVWGYTATPLTRTVDVHIAWLRRKLEPNPRHPRFILTVHGLGYKFVGERAAAPAQGAILTPSVRV
jgi:two-component system, OmpR family, alkaline phosphatase synthesis response regulator PhoP